MNLYLDASALVKEYLTGEPGAEAVADIRRRADLIGTSMVSRVETVAALAKAVRTGALTDDAAHSAREAFHHDWPDLVRVRVTEAVVTRADALAWEEGLRGYDAVQLAAALVWRDGMEEVVIFGAFDLRLWSIATRYGLVPFPDDLPAVIEAWS